MQSKSPWTELWLSRYISVVFGFLQARDLHSSSTDGANNTALFLSFKITKRSSEV